MTIRFLCQHCHRYSDLPDSAGGKRGDCPLCGQSAYVAGKVDENEILDIAPIDMEEERRTAAVEDLHKSREQDLMKACKTEVPIPLEHRDSLEVEDLHHFVVNYCLDMTDGKRQRAQLHVTSLRKFGPLGLQAVRDFQSHKVDEPALKRMSQILLDRMLVDLVWDLG